MTPPKILIVGAGIAGLAVARALENVGITFDIVERHSEPSCEGAGIYLPGNAARALEHLHLREEVTDRAYIIERQVMYDEHGRLLHDMDVASFWSGVGPCLAISRPALHSILLAAVKTPIQYDYGVHSIQNTTGLKRVTFNTGESKEYALIIGADGVNSLVRQHLSGQSSPHDLGFRCWRFVTANNAGLEHWTTMLGGHRTMLAVPLEKNQLYVYADTLDVTKEPITSETSSNDTIDDIRHRFSDFADPLQGVLSGLTGSEVVHTSRLREVPCEFRLGASAALVGDAAHASSPSMAQGAAMSFEDAMILADSLKASADIRAALNDYACRRQPRLKWVQLHCHSRDGIRSKPRWLRNIVISRLGDKLYRRAYGPLQKSPAESYDA